MNIATLTEIGSNAGWLVAGVLVLIGIFGRQKTQIRIEDSNLASNLIKNLTTKTEIQEKEITALRGKEVEQGKELAHLQGQVKVLSDILQGRDPDTQKFIKNIPELISITRENNALAKANSEAITTLTKTLTTFMEKMVTIAVKA